MPGGLPFLPVLPQVGFQVGYIHRPQAQKDGLPQPADAPKAVLAVGGDADFGMRLLVGQGRQRGVGDAVILALIGKGFARPGQQDDVQRLLKAVFAFAVVNAHNVVGADIAAAPHAELKPPLAELVHGGRFLSDAERMEQRQHLHGHPHPQPLGAGGNGRGDDDGRGQHGAAGIEMHLAQPDRIQAQRLGQVNFGHCRLERIGVRCGAAHRKIDIDSKVHCHCDTSISAAARRLIP